MSLEEYQRKRCFGQTPEPYASSGKAPSGSRRFCLQRHQASRLHFDLRIELGGALKSWAVPKGPTLKALDKRLAVPTEDHPLEYLDWEGVIPAGEYGGGVMMVFDIGEWEPVLEGDPEQQLQAGELKIRLWGKKVQGEWTLVRTDRDNNWLWIKKADAWADSEWDPEDHLWSAVSGRTPTEIANGLPTPEPRKSFPQGAVPAPLPLEIEPMLAEPGKPFDDDDWFFELKWDGIRALAFGQEQTLRLAGRRGTALTGNFPELRYLRANLAAESFVLDGELVVLDAEGRPEFSRVLSRLKAPSHRAFSRLARTDKATYYIFDLLYLDGHDLRGVPLESRRELLSEVFRPDPWIRVSEAIPNAGRALFALTLERGLEGLMAKHRQSLYQSGRSAAWKKLKARHTADVVVVGYTPSKAKAPFGALHIARYEDHRLVAVGKVGSGFASSDHAEVFAKLHPNGQKTSLVAGLENHKEQAVWVEPEVVIEIEFQDQTKDGIFRHSSFMRLRDDLSPQDCSDDPPPAAQSFLEVDGRSLTITNPGKVLFPQAGVRKSELVDYYQQVGPLLLPHLRDRPLSLRRFPDGVEGPDFFQKHPPPGTPNWIATSDTEHGLALLAHDQATLVYLANLACIEFHATLARLPQLTMPDGFLIDLDPQEEAPFSLVKDIGRAVQAVLMELDWTGYLKTSGGRGLHIFVPLASGYDFDQSRMAASIFAEILLRQFPGKVTTERVPAKRPKGAVYVDAPQNRTAATIAAPYTVRATASAMLSMPLSWDELSSDFSPADFTIASSMDRLGSSEKLWRWRPDESQRLETVLANLETLMKG